MAQKRGSIPGPGKAIDGLSNTPGRAIVKYINWEELKREFFMDPEAISPRNWLYNVKEWPRGKILNGNTDKHIRGWGDDKAALERRKTETAIAAMLDLQRKRMPDLMAAKLDLVRRIIGDVGKWDRLDVKEKKMCYEILKVELGETTSIKTVGVVTPKDPVVALLESYGVMKDGRIIDVEPIEGTYDSETDRALDEGPSTQVSQG